MLEVLLLENFTLPSRFGNCSGVPPITEGDVSEFYEALDYGN
jgi:hypothetical protein